jgi:hypothetical protein
MAGLVTRTLVKPEPQNARTHAMALLRTRGIHAASIVRVDPWGIAFVRRDGSLATAWITYSAEKKQCLVRTENGLPAFPS